MEAQTPSWLDWRRLALFGLVIAVATLAAALISQFAFGLEPCPMCVMQRWPYVAGIAAAGAALLFGRRKAVGAVALGLAGLSFDVGVALGAWHSGVEWGWFPPPDCQGDLVGGADVTGSDVMGMAFGQPCDVREPFFLGLSMANWNVVVSLLLGVVFAAALAARLGFSPSARKRRRADLDEPASSR